MAGAALLGRRVMWRVGTVVLVHVVCAIFSKAVEGTGFALGRKSLLSTVVRNCGGVFFFRVTQRELRPLF